MSYWVREIAGWLLVLLGLFVFLVVYDYCERLRIFDAGIMAVVGIFIFRGGIHLLKVAVAARVCRQVQEQAYGPRRSVGGDLRQETSGGRAETNRRTPVTNRR